MILSTQANLIRNDRGKKKKKNKDNAIVSTVEMLKIALYKQWFLNLNKMSNVLKNSWPVSPQCYESFDFYRLQVITSKEIPQAIES